MQRWDWAQRDSWAVCWHHCALTAGCSLAQTLGKDVLYVFTPGTQQRATSLG